MKAPAAAAEEIPILPVIDEIWELRVKDAPDGENGWYHFVLILGQSSDQETLGQAVEFHDQGMSPILITYVTSKFTAAYQRQKELPMVAVVDGWQLPEEFTLGIIGGLSPLIQQFTVTREDPTGMHTDSFYMKLAISLPKAHCKNLSFLTNEYGNCWAKMVWMDLSQWIQNHKDDLNSTNNGVNIVFHWNVKDDGDVGYMEGCFTSELPTPVQSV